jgi:uncharacterized membrane protein
MPDAAAFCPRCGRRMIAAPGAARGTGFLPENFAGALAYITCIPAIVFLARKPFDQNHFVRFHSWQSIFMTVAAVVFGLALRIIFALLGFIPHLGYLLGWLAVLVTMLGWAILWAVALIKALQGEFFRVPVIGDIAEKQAGA